jgi:hypothetical protein
LWKVHLWREWLVVFGREGEKRRVRPGLEENLQAALRPPVQLAGQTLYVIDTACVVLVASTGVVIVASTEVVLSEMD